MKVNRDNLKFFITKTSYMNEIRLIIISVIIILFMLIYRLIMPDVLRTMQLEDVFAQILYIFYCVYIVYIIVIITLRIKKIKKVDEIKKRIQLNEEEEIKLNMDIIIYVISRYFALLMYACIIPMTALILMRYLM